MTDAIKSKLLFENATVEETGDFCSWLTHIPSKAHLAFFSAVITLCHPGLLKGGVLAISCTTINYTLRTSK